MSKWKVPFLDLPAEYKALEEEIEGIIRDVLHSGRFVLGDGVEKFEKEVAEYLDVRYTVGVNSGTDAMFLSLKALGVVPGDEVITVAHTHISTIAVIVHCGAAPVLVDIGEDYNMDTFQVKDKITKKTRCIIPVHLNGRCCEMSRLMEFGVPIVEDACQALGAEYRGKKAGTFGVGCFSFHPLKVMSAAGDGGLIATNDENIVKRVRLLRNHGTLDRINYKSWGYNSRLDELQAAILSIKLGHLDEWIVKRQAIAVLYNKGLQKLPICLPFLFGSDTFNSYVIRTKERDKLKTFLADKGIETFVSWYPPIHKQMGLNFNLSVTEQVSREVLSLPIHPYMSEESIKYVVSCIREFYE